MELPAFGFRDLVSAYAVRPVRADKDIAAYLVLAAASVSEQDSGPVLGHVDRCGVAHAEADIGAVACACVCEVGEYVGLRVEPYRLTYQILEVDPVPHPAEPELDALVLIAFAQHPIRDAGIDEKPDAVAFQNSCPDRLLGADIDYGGQMIAVTRKGTPAVQ